MSSATFAMERRANLDAAQAGFGERLLEHGRRLAEKNRKHPLLSKGLAFALVLMLSFMVPTIALAWDPIGDAVDGFVNSLVNGAIGEANNNLKSVVSDIKGLTEDDMLTADFDNLFGTSDKTNKSISAMITQVSDVVIKPVAQTILSIVLLLQLLKIVRRFDQGSGTMSAAKEVFVLVTLCVFFMMLVDNADTIVKAVFQLILKVVKDISGLLGSTETIEVAIAPSTGAGSTDLMRAVSTWLITFILRGVSLITIVACNLAFIGRGLTIYLMTAFAPIPLSLLGFEETKSWCIGYLRSYIAECLSAAVLVISLWASPVILMTILNGGTIDAMNPTTFCKLAACIWLTFTMCNKSGQIAGKILGQG